MEIMMQDFHLWIWETLHCLISKNGEHIEKNLEFRISTQQLKTGRKTVNCINGNNDARYSSLDMGDFSIA